MKKFFFIILMLVLEVLFPKGIYADTQIQYVFCNTGGRFEFFIDSNAFTPGNIKKIQASSLCTPNSDMNKELYQEGKIARLQESVSVINAILTPSPTAIPTVILIPTRIFLRPSPTITNSPTITPTIKPTKKSVVTTSQNSNVFQNIWSFLNKIFIYFETKSKT